MDEDDLSQEYYSGRGCSSESEGKPRSPSVASCDTVSCSSPGPFVAESPTAEQRIGCLNPQVKAALLLTILAKFPEQVFQAFIPTKHTTEEDDSLREEESSGVASGIVDGCLKGLLGDQCIREEVERLEISEDGRVAPSTLSHLKNYLAKNLDTMLAGEHPVKKPAIISSEASKPRATMESNDALQQPVQIRKTMSVTSGSSVKPMESNGTRQQPVQRQKTISVTSKLSVKEDQRPVKSRIASASGVNHNKSTVSTSSTSSSSTATLPHNVNSQQGTLSSSKKKAENKIDLSLDSSDEESDASDLEEAKPVTEGKKKSTVYNGKAQKRKRPHSESSDEECEEDTSSEDSDKERRASSISSKSILDKHKSKKACVSSNKAKEINISREQLKGAIEGLVSQLAKPSKGKPKASVGVTKSRTTGRTGGMRQGSLEFYYPPQEKDGHSTSSKAHITSSSSKTTTTTTAKSRRIVEDEDLIDLT